MANNKKFVTKNGLQTQNASFVSPDNTNTIEITMTDSDSLEFQGDVGQLFSIVDSMEGVIFSVNDISGIPSIEVNSSGLITLAEYTGNVVIGSSTDSGNAKLQITGNLEVSGDILASINALSDVTISSPVANQVIGYTGSNWINKTLNLGDLGDVDTSGVTAGDTIIYNGFTWATGAGGGGGGGASITISDTPPTDPAPVAGNLWWDSSSGRLKLYYFDGTSSQWVDAAVSPTGYTGSRGYDGGTYYDMSLYVDSNLGASETLLTTVVSRTFSYLSNFTGSYAIAGTAATTTNTILSIKKNGTEFGTITFNTGNTTGVLSTSGESFVPGDIVSVVGPASPDAVLKNISITLAGVKP